MRAAMHSFSFRNRFKEDKDFTIFKALDLTASWGFTGIEIMSGAAGATPPGGDFASDDPAFLKSVRKYADALGIRIDSLSTYNDFAHTSNEEWRLANIAYIKRWLKIAGDLGVPNIRMLTGYFPADKDRTYIENLTRAGIAECIPVAEACGVNMSIENHSSVFAEADEILALIRELDSPRLTTCPDPTNWGGKEFWESNGSTVVREKVFNSAAALAPKATQSHLKIKGITPDGQLIGFGHDLDRLLRSYRAANYDGAIAFESIAEGDLLAPLAEARKIVEVAIARIPV